MSPVRYDDVSRMKRLLDLTLTLNSTMDLEALLDTIIECATDLLSCEAASLLIYDDETSELQFVAATGVASDRLPRFSVPLQGSLAGTIFRENRPLVIDNTTVAEGHFDALDLLVGFETRSLVGVPMRVEGSATGVLEGINKKDGRFTGTDVETLSVIAAQAAIALRNARQLASLRDAHDTLREIDSLKSHIMAITSHELRTPLTTILGYAGILREEAPDSLGSAADEVLSAGDRMREIIDMMTHLLDLLNHDVDEGHFEPVDVVEVIHSAVEAVEPAERERIELQVPDRRVIRLAHEAFLRDAVRHLLDNALRFTPRDRAVRIRLVMSRGITVDIEDEGIGLAASELEKIFEAFYQVEHHLARNYGGLGLGLTFAREVARIHGGRLSVRSAGLDKGSCFTLNLPIG